MIRSDNLDALNAALSAAQGEFEAVSKTANNPFFKSKYAALPDVVKAATPILAKHGLAVWQGADAGFAPDHSACEILHTVVLHSSGQYIGSSALLLPVEDKNGVINAQAQGSAMTYQRRYQYMAALGLVADEDDDGNAATQAGNRSRSKAPSGRKETRQGKSPAPASDGHSGGDNASQDAPLIATETLEELARLYRESGMSKGDMQALYKKYGAEGKKANELTEKQGTWVVLALRDRAKQATEPEAA